MFVFHIFIHSNSNCLLSYRITRHLVTRCSARTCKQLSQRSSSRMMAPVARSFSSSTATGTNSTPPSLDEARHTILESALKHVHEHGWSQDAISAAVVSSNLPLSMMGMVTPNSLITHFMDTCQEQFQKTLDTSLTPMWKEESNPDLSARLEKALRARLEYVVPYVKSNRWHEGMALGATKNTTITASQLESMIQSIADSILVGTDHAPLGIAERTAIGALYISTELHLLADDSLDYEATWAFLKSRIAEMHLLANSANWTSVVSGDTAIAATAVATSLCGAVVSLLQPAARGVVSAAASTVVPHLATFLQPLQSQQTTSGDGSRTSDYNVIAASTDTGSNKSKTLVTASN